MTLPTRLMISWANSLALTIALITIGGCDACGPMTAAERIAREPITGCRQQERGVLRATDNPAASTQPSLVAIGEGHVLAWIDDRILPPAIYLSRIDPLGQPQGELHRLSTGPRPHRPRLATSGRTIAVVYTDLDEEGNGVVRLQAFDLDLVPLLAEPRELGESDEVHGASITRRDDRYLVGWSEGDTLRLFEIQETPAPGDAPRHSGGSPDGGLADASSETDAASVEPRLALTVSEQRVAFDESMRGAGNVDLLFHHERLYLAADHPQGGLIQIGLVGQRQVERFSQVIDDRRSPESFWCCPALGPLPDGKIALLWQGPAAGLSSLYFLGFDDEGNSLGREINLEGRVIDESDDRVLGRAPVFQPDLATATYGLMAAFTDNRYANSEILLAPFSCSE